MLRSWGFPGPPAAVLTVDTVAELRALVLRARTEPTIERLTYWHAREWVGSDPPHDCGGVGGYVPAGISDHVCRCGLHHRTYRCHRCGSSITDPPLGPGCGPIPPDPGE